MPPPDRTEIAATVRESLDPETRREFLDRIDRQADRLAAAIEAGELDNDSFAMGLELEVYAVDDRGRLAPLPEAVYDREGVNKELGLHNAEVNTAPSVFDPPGVEEQERLLRTGIDRVREAGEDAGVEVVLDAMWAVPPPDGSLEYLGAVEEVDGVTFAANMREDPRYRALDNDILRAAGGAIALDLPGARHTLPTILAESLTTSMQPHLQVPTAEAFPRYYNAAIRTLGPILALSTNSPFLPTDLYDDPDEGLIDRTYHELRIPVFEQSINAEDPGKVRFPDDIESAIEVVERFREEPPRAPFLREWIDDDDEGTFSDSFWELDYQRGMYWRWLRCVVGGQAIDEGNDERSLRIEYRPIPTQPTARDVLGMQVLTGGLVRGLVAADHPVGDLGWESARESFYSAVREGLDADLHWVTADGEHTTDPEELYPDLFRFARRGLREQGFDAGAIDRYLGPIERRWERRRTPSRWKQERVRGAIEDGAAFDEAVARTQRAYRRLSATGTPFADWERMEL